MLQLSGTLRNATWITPLSAWRMNAQQLLAASSRATNPSLALAQTKEDEKPSRTIEKPSISPRINKKNPITSENPMIQAAFDNLKRAKSTDNIARGHSIIETKIRGASNVEGLLSIANNKDITRENAFAIVTVLLDWVNNGRAELKVFELDTRFLYLCTLLSRPATPPIAESQQISKSRRFMDELSLFYSINEITEATKEVSKLPVPQMIKVMSGLASQKRRSTPLLRALSFNITRSSDVLNVKQLSDLLYSMSILNYTDEVLLQKVCDDLMQSTHSIPKSSVTGSILRSLGTLRYKNEELIDKLSEWVVDSKTEVRPQDLCSLFLTLAMLGYTPANVDVLRKVVVDQLNETDMAKPSDWLDIVWSLTVLQLSQNRHIASVLDSQFIDKLMDSNELPSLKNLKLLNINGAAKLLTKDYKGPFLPSDSRPREDPTIRRSKEKELFSKCVAGTLENIFPSPEYCKTNVDTGLGFILDAEVCINRQGQRLPVNMKIDKKKGSRIAVVAQCYHDFCRGKQDPLGYNNFYCRLLEAQGYKVVTVPHTEFSADDKIVKRVTYINDRIKQIAK